jgi:hypothetical protein
LLLYERQSEDVLVCSCLANVHAEAVAAEPAPAAESSSGGSSIGIAIGVGIGCLILGAAAGFFGMCTVAAEPRAFFSIKKTYKCRI